VNIVDKMRGEAKGGKTLLLVNMVYKHWNHIGLQTVKSKLHVLP
jgi:hypothetical protein